MFGKRFTAVFGIMALLAGSTLLADRAWADDNGAENAKLTETLQQKLNEAYGPIWKAGDPAKFVHEVLADNVVITASDSPKVWAGEQQSISVIAELMAGYPRITATAVWTAPIGDKAAYQFVEFQLMPADQKEQPVIAKSLYVWVKTKDGWRIAADHYSYTGMDKPTGLDQKK